MAEKAATEALPGDVSATEKLLRSGEYVANRDLATVVYLALRMGRPLLLEGEAGVGKTEIAKVLAATLGRDLIRLQCFEGLDLAMPLTSGITRGKWSLSGLPKQRALPQK